jgi:hypothetical protein
MVKFEPEQHVYTSVKEDDAIEWTSVTSVLKKFKEPFDSHRIASKSGKNEKSKWYGLSPEEIQKIWKAEADRACALGNFYHDQREADILECETLDRYGVTLPVITPMEDEHGVKVAPSQKLIDGIYPEHLCYLRSAGVCGQSDLVEVVNGYVHITDYKTNKEIKQKSFVNWEGVSKKMLPPLQHLDDCNYNHYNLQLSIYMYIILKHNPKLKPGNIVISHVTFEEAGRDKYDYPISKLDENGNPIVKEVVRYEMSYLKDEVMQIMKEFKPVKL